MSRLARCLFLSKGTISKDDAREIARAECALRGLTWEEPVNVRRDFGDWEVWTNANYRGGNIRVIVGGGSGAVGGVFGPMPR
ncbi:hypothetical protein FF36_01313 [Frankia torreyi]|uniref:Uncharacterized protein n=1 Tax=Frankia torreyi TaxID=1856 RepID=A0A0D8BJ26_9ACTN|nr:hypothetical protein FF36_01313 [Frankia torreyi]KQM06886.1 hypothetical protein FF86_1006139 [Frankia sp. CpI1-P]